MRTKEDYIKMIYYMCKDDSRRKEYENDLDLNQMESLYYLYTKNETFTNENWWDFYNKNKDDKEILEEMIKTRRCPLKLLETIVMNTDIVKKDIDTWFKQNEHEREILTNSVKYNLSQGLFDIIYHYEGKDILSFFDISLSYKSNANEYISEKSMKQLCQKLIKNHKSKKEKTYSSARDSTLDVFSYIEDREYIRKILALDPHEDIKTALFNNIKLDKTNPDDEKLLNDIFDSGVVIENIKNNVTPYVSKICSELLLEGYHTGFDEETGLINKKPGKVYLDSKSTLSNWLEKGYITADCEYDLALRIVNTKDRSTSYFTSTLFNNTKNIAVMKLIKDIKSLDKQNAYISNKNLTEEIIGEYVFDLCNKIQKYSKKDKLREVPDKWYEHIGKLCDRITLREKDYELLMKIGKYKLEVALLLSPKTPDKELQKALDKIENTLGYKDEERQFAICINRFTKTHMLEERTIKELKKFVTEMTHGGYVTRNKDGILEIGNKNNENYIKQCLKWIAMYHEKRDSIEVKEFLKNTHEKYPENQLIEFAMQCFNNYYEEKKIEDELKQKENEIDIVTFSDTELKNTLNTISNKILNYHSNRKINMMLHEDEFFKVYNEMDRRGIISEEKKKTKETKLEETEK